MIAHDQGWPEPYMYTVYDRVFGDFPAKNTVCKPYIYDSGQPYTWAHEARPQVRLTFTVRQFLIDMTEWATVKRNKLCWYDWMGHSKARQTMLCVIHCTRRLDCKCWVISQHIRLSLCNGALCPMFQKAGLLFLGDFSTHLLNPI